MREVEPLNNEFELVERGQYWTVVVGGDEDSDTVLWIPRSRVHESTGKREFIRQARARSKGPKGPT